MIFRTPITARVNTVTSLTIEILDRNALITRKALTVGFQNHSSDGEKYKTNLGIIFKGLDLFFGMGQKHQILSTKLNAK